MDYSYEIFDAITIYIIITTIGDLVFVYVTHSLFGIVDIGHTEICLLNDKCLLLMEIETLIDRYSIVGLYYAWDIVTMRYLCDAISYACLTIISFHLYTWIVCDCITQYCWSETYVGIVQTYEFVWRQVEPKAFEQIWIFYIYSYEVFSLYVVDQCYLLLDNSRSDYIVCMGYIKIIIFYDNSISEISS